MASYIELSPIEIKLSFVASCVEGAARKLGVSYEEVYQRMKKVDMLEKHIFRHYDMLHTQSREYITDDVIECLTNWERRAQ